MTSPVEFCRRMIADAEKRRREAGEAGDYPAFESAQRDIENYKHMLERYKDDGN